MPTVIPAEAKRRAGIQKALKCLDSRFRGNDEKSVGMPFPRLVSEFFRSLLAFILWSGPRTECRPARRSSTIAGHDEVSLDEVGRIVI